MKLEKLIESILFYRGEPTKIKKMAEWLSVGEGEIIEASKNLEKSLKDRGIVLISKEDELVLGTTKEASEIIETITKEEFHRDLGKAGLETLSIILYLGPVSKSDIDFIRGVSSSFILRNLMIRGLVERVENPEDKRSYLYKPTFDLLGYLGIQKTEDLSEYLETKEFFKNCQIEFEKNQNNENSIKENL